MINCSGIIILFDEYLSMCFNQITQSHNSTSHKLITLRPPPLLAFPSYSGFAPKDKSVTKETKTSRQMIAKPPRSSLCNRIFQNKEEGQKNCVNIEQMLRQKLKIKVSEYENTVMKDVGMLGCKKLHKTRKDRAKEFGPRYIEDLQSKRQSQILLACSRQDQIFHFGHSQDGLFSSRIFMSGQGKNTNSMDKSKQLEEVQCRFRSSSVMALGRANTQKRVKLVLKSNRKQKINQKAGRDSQNYLSTDNLERCYHQEENKPEEQKPIEPPLQKLGTCVQFRVKKRNNRDKNIKKIDHGQPQRTKIQSPDKDGLIFIEAKQQVIGAWQNKADIAQVNRSYKPAGLLLPTDAENIDDGITQFVERERHNG